MKKLFVAGFVFALLISARMPAQDRRLEGSKTEGSITYFLTHPLHEVESVSKEVQSFVDCVPDAKEIKKVFVQITVASFNSGNSNRDSHALETIESVKYPKVKFTSLSVFQYGDSIKVSGPLTFHGVTKNITLAAALKWEAKRLVVDGGFTVSLTAFSIERPSLMMIPVNDVLRFTFHQVYNF